MHRTRSIFAFSCLLVSFGVTWADQPMLVVSCTDDRKLETYALDDQGCISLRHESAIDAKPATSRFDSVGRHLFVGTSAPTTIQAFRIDETRLVPLQTVPVSAKPSYLWVSPNGQFLLASYFTSGEVTVHRIEGEGRLSNDPIQRLQLDPHAHCITTDPKGHFVFVSHTSTSRISMFRFDDETGTLTPNQPAILQQDNTLWTRHLWFHPTEEVVFGSNERGKSISVYAFDSDTGLLEETQTLPAQPKNVEGKATTSHVHVHPSGKFAYIANRGHGSIAAFRFDKASHKLSFVHRVATSKVPRSFSLSPDGRFLVVAGQKSNLLSVYRIDDDGRLVKSDDTPCGKTPWWVSFSTAAGVSADPSTEIDENGMDRSLTLGQGTLCGEVSEQSAFLQARLTKGRELDETGGLPGANGFLRFEYSEAHDFSQSTLTAIQAAPPERDFIVRSKLTSLKSDTRYFYRPHFGASKENLAPGKAGSFRTLPGRQSDREVSFIVGSCMNYIKFMHGREGRASGPLTATQEDKRLGFPAFATMAKLKPEFFVGTGDIVYYDNPFRVSRSVPELRKCWHEQFRFPRMVDFFRQVPTYWSKDDHDFRYNDSDNETNRIPLPGTGIEMFREQLPIATVGDFTSPNYRTHRVSKHLQIWLTEGRDHRSANDSPDGPQKTMWGAKQREWLKSTLATSDAKWKLIVSPTPMVGPDLARKKDNHANLQGFRHEADTFFAWIKEEKIDNLILVCGDRHWQYHSVHPSGINEFACGALNDENSRMGVAPGDKSSSDPEGKVRQLFASPEPSGGFLKVRAGSELEVTHITDDGETLYQVTLP